ncbi:hypothetical protein [Prochlorococcus marinus]|uniref:Uncharacterized protein n=1 Tax=Prochlorococcus marinus (strain MIT 9211) TaxID=93059 RepID=A9BCT5_PROM4|nr:hypothetical protein [Prochlorococcus marinus]ABX09647.1 conserved hypothetical protein [Prochlorococcus marinus str. MIT 9211]
MNAVEQGKTVAFAQALASIGTLVRNYFPSASLNLSPWRDDPETREWFEEDSLDLAVHFPGWSPKLQCRSLLIQLSISNEENGALPKLLGILIRGMTFDGERWRLVTAGDWQPTGSHLPHPDQMNQLQAICRDLFDLFPSNSF